jgi:HEAT repeat protein
MRNLRFLLLLAVCLCPFAGAAENAEMDQDKILAAARLASEDYQRGFVILLQDLGSHDEAVRLKAIKFLGYRQDPEAIGAILPFLDNDTRSKEEVLAAIEALCDIGATGATTRFKALVNNPDKDLRAAALNGLSRLKTVQAIDYTRRAKDEQGPLRASSLTNLGTLKHAEAVDLLVHGLSHDSRPHIRRMCAIGLGDLAIPTTAPNIVDALADPDPGVRRYCAEALVKLHHTAAIPHLLIALEANVAGDYVNAAVMSLSGQNFGFDPRANQLERTAAVEKGFVWWAANAKDLGR